jgi:hypothetical protein
MSSSNSSERQLVARLAAHESWAHTKNRTTRTAPAREAFLAKFEDQVDPRRELPPAERAKRAANARKAHFTRLALKSAQSRRGASTRRQAYEELAEATRLISFADEASKPFNAENVSEAIVTDLRIEESRGAGR